MAMEYTRHDRMMAGSVDLILELDASRTTDPEGVAALGVANKRFPFQFPPRVTSDGKSAKWKPSETKSYEPVFLWDGGEPRTLTIEATYILDGGKWTGARITNLVRGAKAYFYTKVMAKSAEEAGGFFGPIVRIRKLYGAVEANSTWRMESVGISYGETMVEEDNGTRTAGFANQTYYPLVTKITFDLKSWTKVGNTGNEAGNGYLGNDKLEVRPSVAWF